jgi:hypothetical protein
MRPVRTPHGPIRTALLVSAALGGLLVGADALAQQPAPGAPPAGAPPAAAPAPGEAAPPPAAPPPAAAPAPEAAPPAAAPPPAAPPPAAAPPAPDHHHDHTHPLPKLLKQVGGHIGVVIPFFTTANAGFSSIKDAFTLGISTGLGIPIIGPMKFDAEIVTLVNTKTRAVDILIHPGLIFGLPAGFALGFRGAWETAGVAGFTPLVNKGFAIGDGKAFYLELDFPVRFGNLNANDYTQGVNSSFTFAFHFGFGF